jgi:cysteine synthase A
MDLPFLERDLVSDYLSVSDNESIDAARNLAKREGIFAGFSSGANVAAALKLLSGVEKNSSIALLINDSGLKYLSTDLYDF